MKWNWGRWGAMPLLAAALWMAGCSEQGSPIGPAEQPVVQGPSESLSLGDDLGAILRGVAPDLTDRVNEAVIGPEGGVLYVSLHHLYVPKGAVAGPTRFRMELPEDGSIGAALTATSLGSAVENDVGAAGFKRPLYLTFSYAYATNVPRNPAGIKIFWARPDGSFEAQPTAVNWLFRTATGVLTHFSDYILAIP